MVEDGGRTGLPGACSPTESAGARLRDYGPAPVQPSSADTTEAAPARSSSYAPILAGIAVCGPAAVTAYLALRSGGFFAGAPAIVAVVLGIALTLRLTLAESPFEGFGPAMICATVGLGCFAAWTLVSALWSHAPAQALVEFDRALMYWLGLVLFGSMAWTRERIVWAVRILAVTMAAFLSVSF